MATPLTSRPKKLSVLIQWVMRTTAECRGESRTSEIRVARPGRYADSDAATRAIVSRKARQKVGDTRADRLSGTTFGVYSQWVGERAYARRVHRFLTLDVRDAVIGAVDELPHPWHPTNQGRKAEPVGGCPKNARR